MLSCAAQMIVEPELRIPDFAKAGADIISVHAEQSSTIHLHRVVNQVRNAPQLLCHARDLAGSTCCSVLLCTACQLSALTTLLHFLTSYVLANCKCAPPACRHILPPHPSSWHHPAHARHIRSCSSTHTHTCIPVLPPSTHTHTHVALHFPPLPPLLTPPVHLPPPTDQGPGREGRRGAQPWHPPVHH